MKSKFNVEEPLTQHNQAELKYDELKLEKIIPLGKEYTCCNLGPLNKKIYIGSKDGEVSIIDISGKRIVSKQLHQDAI